MRQLTPLIRQGRSSGHTAQTQSLRSSATTSIGNRIPNVCTPDDGWIQRPVSISSPFRPSNPISRVRHVSANAILVPITVARVTFRIVTCAIWMVRNFRVCRFRPCVACRYTDFLVRRRINTARTMTNRMAETTWIPVLKLIFPSPLCNRWKFDSI